MAETISAISGHGVEHSIDSFFFDVTQMPEQGMVTEVDDIPELFKVIASADDLPTLPEVVKHLRKMLDDGYSNVQDVARLIQDDPVIVTRILKIVNSVFYAPAHGVKITHLPAAIARLGFMTVINIALSTSVFSACQRVSQPVFDRREFWRHSICVGIVGSVLYDHCEDVLDPATSKESVHLAGIVHDIGKIIFERYANDQFHAAIESARQDGVSIVTEEQRFLGLGHNEVGGWLCQKWNIDESIQDVVLWHHSPESCCRDESKDLVKIIHVADYICHQHEIGDSANPCPLLDMRILEDLNLSEEKINEMMPDIQREVDKSEILMSLA